MGRKRNKSKNDRRMTVDTYIKEKTMNHEGYRDDTAEQAIRNYNRNHVKEAAHHLKAIASLLGFEIVELRDRKTGRNIRI